MSCWTCFPPPCCHRRCRNLVQLFGFRKLRRGGDESHVLYSEFCQGGDLQVGRLKCQWGWDGMPSHKRSWGSCHRVLPEGGELQVGQNANVQATVYCRVGDRQVERDHAI